MCCVGVCWCFPFFLSSFAFPVLCPGVTYLPCFIQLVLIVMAWGQAENPFTDCLISAWFPQSASFPVIFPDMISSTLCTDGATQDCGLTSLAIAMVASTTFLAFIWNWQGKGQLLILLGFNWHFWISLFHFLRNEWRVFCTPDAFHIAIR